MKRYWYLMAIAATLLASCNKDEDGVVQPVKPVHPKKHI